MGPASIAYWRRGRREDNHDRNVHAVQVPLFDNHRRRWHAFAVRFISASCRRIASVTSSPAGLPSSATPTKTAPACRSPGDRWKRRNGLPKGIFQHRLLALDLEAFTVGKEALQYHGHPIPSVTLLPHRRNLDRYAPHLCGRSDVVPSHSGADVRYPMLERRQPRL